MTRYVAIAEIRAALSAAPYSCPFHGKDFGFLGTENGQPGGEPRCESCKQPWRVMVALSALDQLDARVIELQAQARNLQGQARELDRVRGAVLAVADELTDMAMHAPGVWSLSEQVDERLRGALGIVPDPDTTGTVRG